MRRLLAPAILLLAVVPAAAENIFEPARKPGKTVVLTLGDQTPSPETLAQPPMLRQIRGIVTELKGRQLADLIETVDGKTAPEIGPDAKRVCVVHLGCSAGDRSVAIDQRPDGTYFASTLEPPKTVNAGSDDSPKSKALRALLRRDRVDRLLASTGAFLGGVSAGATTDPRAEVFEVSKPYQIGLVTLDSRTIRERIGTSAYFKYDPTSREIGKETFFARLPSGYDSHRPAGLIVWMDASLGGQPPRPLFKALDQYGMICIGAGAAGNDRAMTERLQLALDAVATAKRRWHIDSDRVYALGISGGGKMASTLAPCFPDIFKGGIALVGLSSYEDVPTGEGKQIWPAAYTRPAGKRLEALKGHRLAVVTGSRDFNHEPIIKTLARMNGDRPEIKLFDIEGMGHEFPSPEALVGQIGWVDESAAGVVERREREAEGVLAKALESHQRLALLDVIERWPWTASAWRAVESLEK